jgi:hypothetical protein
MNLSHPVNQLFDAVAYGGRPPAADIDEVVADLTRFDDPKIPAATLRRRIKETVDKIVEAREEGNSGEARRIARESAGLLADELGEYVPPRSSEGKTIAEIVDSIPRGGF